jgi:DNA-binding MarR family transcriptional regulator
VNAAARKPTGTAFLLSQLGGTVASRFAEATARLGLSPSDAGVLRLVSKSPGISQRELADRLGAVPSRVVAIIDSLEGRDLVSRKRSATDRRNYELGLTRAGTEMLRELRSASEANDAAILSALSVDEVAELHLLLEKMRERLGLVTDVHPGYRNRS